MLVDAELPGLTDNDVRDQLVAHQLWSDHA